MTDNKEPQNFVGGIVIDKVLGSLIEKALEAVAKRPNTDMTKDDVPVATAVVEQAVKKELDERLKHITNQESPLQSRVTIGSVMAVMGAAAGVVQLYTDGVVNTWDDYSPHVFIIGGALFALYGRFIAKKPLGA